jgi:peptidoglycan/LPS O-acetylase OafA/YrhL
VPADAAPVEVRPPAEAGARLHFVDGMRGLAALMVFGFHVTSFFGGDTWLQYGWLGVQVFFVLSGFVIAHSIGDARVTARYFGQFVLRRSLRLDPPYWAVLALALTLGQLSNVVLTDRTLPFPGWPAVLAHLFYLQNVLDFGDVVDVFWSLCIEMQLYLVFILALGVMQRCGAGPRREGVTAAAVLALLAAVSLALQVGTFRLPMRAWFLDFWHVFSLGILATWTLRGKVGRGWFYGVASVMAVAAFRPRWNIQLAVALGTGLLLFVVGRWGRLRSGLNVAPLQFMGRISYSFYLIHTVVLSRLCRLMVRTGIPPEENGALAAALGLGLSLAAAYLLYRLVERPCAGLSKRLKRTLV